MATRVTFNQGICTSRDRADLAPGEAVGMTGLYYKPGDSVRAWKIPGRSQFGDTASAAKVKGLALCKYDTGGTDRLIAYSGTAYYSATPGTTGSFASLVTGLSSSGTHLTSVHYNDRWYLGNGYDRNRVISAAGAVRIHGMLEPAQAPTAAVSAVGGAASNFPTTASSGFTNPALAYDSTGTYLSTYAYAQLAAVGNNTTTWSGWASNTDANRRLYVKWGLAGALPELDGPSRTAREYDVTVLIEYSVNSGSTWATLASYANRTSAIADTESSVAVTANSNLIQVRATLTYNNGTKSAALRIYNIVISSGSTVSTFSTTVGVYYALTEYDATNDLESPYVLSAKVTLSAQNTATLTLPSAALNSTATHWRIYRTTDGGTPPQDLRLIGQELISSTTFVDRFETYPKDIPGTLTLNLLKIQTDPDVSALYFTANGTPGAFVHMNAYGPFLIGLLPQFPRTLYYSLPGFPEYWPTIYQVESFPMPERDELVTTAVVGDTLMVAASEAMMAIDGLPEATGGFFQSATVRVLKGQPGCVGRYAMTAFSVEGEPRAAWVSPFGVHMTNGQTALRISDDIAWSETFTQSVLSSCVLHWDRERSCLILAYDADGGGTNDRYFLIHMGTDQRKGNGQPKWTGPHYGAIACMASGMVSGTYRVFSGHTTDGKVYLEWNTATGADASQAYSGTQLPMIYTSGRSYDDEDDIVIDWLNLRHTDWGTGQTATLAWTTGTDDYGTSTSTTKTVALASQQGTEVFIGRSGEWHNYTLTHTGTGTGALLDMRVRSETTS